MCWISQHPVKPPPLSIENAKAGSRWQRTASCRRSVVCMLPRVKMGHMGNQIEKGRREQGNVSRSFQSKGFFFFTLKPWKHLTPPILLANNTSFPPPKSSTETHERGFFFFFPSLCGSHSPALNTKPPWRERHQSNKFGWNVSWYLDCRNSGVERAF